MNYGLYLSASGVMVNSHRQDVLSNNLANVNTAGFKPMFTDLRQRSAESVENGSSDFGLANDLLDRLGGGVLGDEQRVSFRSGAAISTGNGLDAALTSDNAFFAVEHTDPNTGAQDVRLTRSGQFQVSVRGELVTQAGHRVLNENGDPIQIGDAKAVIGRTGQVVLYDDQGNTIGTDQLQVVAADLNKLRPSGENLFAMTGGDSREAIDNPVLLPGHYESSGTNAIKTMMDIVSATKAATSNANMIRYHDQMLNASVNTFGRLA